MNKGYDVWLDEKNLLPGQDWNLEIGKAIREADAVIVVLSPKMVKKEGYIQKELKLALDFYDEKPEGEIYVIPALLEECEIPRALRSLQYVDLRQNDSGQRLINALNERALSLSKKQIVPPRISESIVGKLPKASQSPIKPINQEQLSPKKKEQLRFLNTLGVHSVGIIASVFATITIRLLSDEYRSANDFSLLSIITDIIADSDFLLVFLILIAIVAAFWAVSKSDHWLVDEQAATWLRYLLSLVIGYFAGFLADILAIFVVPLIIFFFAWLIEMLGGSSGSKGGSTGDGWQVSRSNSSDLDYGLTTDTSNSTIENPLLLGSQNPYDHWNNYEGNPFGNSISSDETEDNIYKRMAKNWNLDKED